MKKIQSYIIAILAIGLVMVGCNKLEPYESITVATEPVTTIEVANVGDSAFTLTMGTDKAGYLGYLVYSDTSTTPEAINILAQSYVDDTATKGIGLSKFESAGDTTVQITNIKHNQYYKVYVAANNTEGAESKVATLVVKTNDSYAPTLLTYSPEEGSTNAVQGTPIVLTFDEPVKVGTGAFTVNYFTEDTTMTVPAENVSASGMSIVIELPYDGHTGESIFLSWEANAVTDLSGNGVSALSSGIDPVEGTPQGVYFALENINFSVDEAIVSPAADSALENSLFNIVIEFPFEISLNDLETNDVKIKYASWLGDITTDIDASKTTYQVDDYTLVIVQPMTANAGDIISLYLAEGVVEDLYGNGNAESDYKYSWGPVLASSSDVLPGQYIVSGKSAFDGSLVSDTVTISFVEGYTDSLAISGFFASLLGSSDTVYGNYYESSSQLVIPEQIIGSGENRYYTAFSDATSSYAIVNTVLEDGSMVTADLSLGVYDGTFEWLGFGEIITSANWVKIAPAPIKPMIFPLSNSSPKQIDYISIKKGKK